MTLPLILGIDPGPVTSGVVLYDPVRGIVLEASAAMPTREVLEMVRAYRWDEWDLSTCHLSMEMIVSYGQRIGMETIGTIEYIGRIKEAWSRGDAFTTYKSRPEIIAHLTGAKSASEKDVKFRLTELHPGGTGTKKSPGPLYGVTSHAWSAMAVAVVASDLLTQARKAQA
jgi:hypothetical protein